MMRHFFPQEAQGSGVTAVGQCVNQFVDGPALLPPVHVLGQELFPLAEQSPGAGRVLASREGRGGSDA